MSPLTFEDLKPLAETFIDQLVKADFAAATTRLDDAMKNIYTEAKLKEAWQQLAAKAGAFKQRAVVGTTEMQGYKIVIVACQFEQAVINAQVVYNDQGQISGLSITPAQPAAVPYNAPAYVNQSAFHETDVTVGSGEWALPGTLSIPNGTGPFPALVLVHGSGPQDRDETLGPNKVFRDLAWGLSSRGIAVLRYEKRTKAHGSKYTPELISKITTKEEVTDDALAAAELLRHDPSVDPGRIFVLGHSLGATLMPRVGKQDPALAGLIVMAGITRPFEDTILDQFTYLYSFAGTLTEQQKASLEILKVQVARVKSPELSLETPAKDLPLGMSPAYWLDLREYCPAEVAKTLTMPILVLQGERDYQVSPAKDFEIWKDTLKDKANVTLKLFPKLNHLFIAGEGKSTPQEYGVEGHVSKDLIDEIAQWIKKN
jgi:dienelactone hydrolase